MLESFEVNGFTVELHQDLDPSSPREWVHGCELVLDHKKYDLPNDADVNLDDFTTEDEFISWLKTEKGALVVHRVYGYDHGGLSLSVSHSYPFDDPWDAGVLGVAYVTAQNWKDCQGTEWTGSTEQLATCTDMIKGDVESYSQYLNGEVYGYRVLDNGEEVDSCWDIYGYDYAKAEAAASAQENRHQMCNGTLNRTTGDVDHDMQCPVHDQEGSGNGDDQRGS
jgi:hypothetical protein